jgi:mannitol-1-phosphate 5-dehydrogenase
MKLSVHFGAGNIGRGFIGLKLYESGYKITFVDVNPHVINALKARTSYDVEYLDDHASRFQVQNCTGLHSVDDGEAVQDSLLRADLITTAVGPNVLPIIAKTLIPMVKQRCVLKMDQYLNVVACENMIGGSNHLKGLVYAELNPQEQAYVEKFIGFPNAAVDRIVPQQTHDDPLFVQVEPFYEWVIDAQQVKGELNIDGVNFSQRLEAYIERKLFTVNTGHASCAYAGYRKHKQTIVEAMSDSDIVRLVRSVIEETGAYLVKIHGFDPGEQAIYIDKTLDRFKNPNIIDDVPRVARTPIRKLSHQERFIKPLLACYENNLPYQAILDALVNILFFDSVEDQEAVRLQEMLQTLGCLDTLSEVTGLEHTHPILKEIEDRFLKQSKII